MTGDLVLYVNKIAYVKLFSMSCALWNLFLRVTGGLACRYAPISGFHGVLAGFLVAVKQIMPDQEIAAFFKLRAKVGYFVMLLFCFGVELYLVICDKQPLSIYRCNIQSCGAACDRSKVVLTKTVHWMDAVVSFCICGTVTFEQLLLLRANSTCAICCIWDIWGLDVLAVSPEET